jgi:hypothetical protein
MKLHRLAILHLNPVPDGWGLWGSNCVIDRYTITIKRIPLTEKKPQAQQSTELARWLVTASVDAAGHISFDEKRRILVANELRAHCETAIENAANTISVLEGCSRSILSPMPCIALEYENAEEKGVLLSSAGIKTQPAWSESDARTSLPRSDARLIAGLSDRMNGVALLAEAYSGGEATRYRDFVRFFELSFGLSTSQLPKKLSQFLAPAMGYTREEVQRWIDLRDPHSHADFRKARFIATSADVRQFLLRMEQACLDVLFNKAVWMDPSRSRRNLWFPDAISTSPAGNVVVKQGATVTARIRCFDEYGVFPRDLGAVISGFEMKNLYAKVAQ